MGSRCTLCDEGTGSLVRDTAARVYQIWCITCFVGLLETSPLSSTSTVSYNKLRFYRCMGTDFINIQYFINIHQVWVPFQQCCTRGKLLRMISTVAMISKSKTWMNRMNMVRFECEGNQLPDAMCRRLPFSTYLASSMEKSKHESSNRLLVSPVRFRIQFLRFGSESSSGSAGSVRTAGSAGSSS